MGTKSIHDIPGLQDALGINTNKLGAVMLPTQPIDIFETAADLDPADLYVSDDPELFWVNGDVSDKAHITLLYGLITPAYEQQELVDLALAGWERPDYLLSEGVTIFPGPNDAPYAAIVVKLDDKFLDEAHQRLSYLPHINTYAHYQQHMTLCYVKLEAAQHWMDQLDAGIGAIWVGQGLDYGKER